MEYTHNYGDFLEKFTFLMNISKGRMGIPKSAYENFVRILSFLFCLRALKTKFNYLIIVWIPLEVRQFEKL